MGAPPPGRCAAAEQQWLSGHVGRRHYMLRLAATGWPPAVPRPACRPLGDISLPPLCRVLMLPPNFPPTHHTTCRLPEEAGDPDGHCVARPRVPGPAVHQDCGVRARLERHVQGCALLAVVLLAIGVGMAMGDDQCCHSCTLPPAVGHTLTLPLVTPPLLYVQATTPSM